MAQVAPLTLLVANERAEEIKSATISMRGFYPGCRVEAVYSAEEALEWASKQDWHIILLDQQLPNRSGLDILPELRRRVPSTAIIVQAEYPDAAIAVKTMQAGADYCLFKQSPAFLSELPLAARDVLEKRELHQSLDRALERYARLTEHLTETVYELDPEGQVLSMSRAVETLLGYTPEELIGTHYSTLIAPEQRPLAERRFNERRTGIRATRDFELQLAVKHVTLKRPEVVRTRIHASGLYSRQRQFLGTIGVIQEITARTQNPAAIPLPGERPPHPGQSAGEIRPLPDAEHRGNNPTSGRREAALRAPQSLPLIAKPRVQEEPERVSPERRRQPRLAFEMEARLTLSGGTWEGTVRNMSLGGMYLSFDGSVPIRQNQRLRVGLNSEMGVLELPAVVRRLQESPGPTSGPFRCPGWVVVVEFTSLGTIEEPILASFLDALRDPSITLRLKALVTPEQSADLLLGSCRTAAETILSPVAPPSEEHSKETPPRDRRLAIRVNLAVPVHVEALDGSSHPVRQEGFLVNLSLQGACLRLRVNPDYLGRRLVFRVLPPQGSVTQPTNPLADMPECLVMGEVLWTGPDSTIHAETPFPTSEPFVRVGLRFPALHEEHQQGLISLVRRLLTVPGRVEERAEGARLVSEFLEYRNEQGQRIAMYHDHPREPLPPGSPIVIVSPGYGETKKDYIPLAYHLASNGFHVLRYDHTNHVGESDGEIRDSTLSRMKQDLSALLNYADYRWPASPVAVVAANLAGRVALKVAAEDQRVRLLILLAGVIDVQATLQTLHQEDLISTYVRGARRGMAMFLGFNLDADKWLGDATKSGYADLRTTIRDAERIHIPVILFTAEQDDWVRVRSIKEVQTALREHSIRWSLIPEPPHRLHEHPSKARSVFRRLSTCCLEQFYSLSLPKNVLEPAQREIDLQHKLEREQARVRHQPATGSLAPFWKDYLDHFRYIVNFPDYWHLLDQLYRQMHPLEAGARILDVGCGHANLALFLLMNQAYRERHTPSGTSSDLHYVGVDLVSDTLAQARYILMKTAGEAGTRCAGMTEAPAALSVSLCCADLDVPLPFRDNQFDRIICNLVIGYLRDPLSALRKLMRVLAPAGRIIVTNLKPQADLSHSYRTFLQLTARPQEVEEAGRLLRSSGRMKQAESEGTFRSFDQQELAMLLISSGAVKPRVYSAFADQAYIAVAEKLPRRE